MRRCAPTACRWPASLPAGPRRVGVFARCEDCGDGPGDATVMVVGVTMTTPGQRGTFVQYGATPLCRPHAIQRAAVALVADVISLFDGEVVQRRPR